eukprot:gb/GFBE01023249.1/.p1 GENE.gb/GFBE01023249.1/~~gb/GFBE01023249.1/.p1  ORF type:complete len:170 (+),score=27.09 gb/GFBE01023249.1/:2-511(+)
MSAMAEDLGFVLKQEASPLEASKGLMYSNKFRTLNGPCKARAIKYNALKSIHIKDSDPDRSWKSHATNFARGGIQYQGKCYVRDPRTGVWFKHSSSTEFPGYEPSTTLSYVSKEVGALDSSSASSLASTGSLTSTMLKRSSSCPGSPQRKRIVACHDVIPHLSVTLSLK